MRNIKVNTQDVVAEMSKVMYGLFYEEINHAGDGGLYAEMIRNRAFQDSTLPEGTTYYDGEVVTPKGFRADFDASDLLPGWTLETSGDAGASMSLDRHVPRNSRVPNSLKLDIHAVGNGTVKVINAGYWGMSLKAGETYVVRIIARSEDYGGTLRAGFEHASGHRYGQAEITGTQPGWTTYELSVTSSASDKNARFFIEMDATGRLWFDYVSVFPKDTFMGRKNGLRRDLAEMLRDLKPAFLRFPGGCIVEGITLENGYKWKNTIGPVEDRPGFWDLWGYRSTGGLGLHEYLELCEDLNCAAMYVANCGMSCQARKSESVHSREELDEFLQDALDAIEYALGDESTEWGAVRCRNGHPAPFDLRFVEIGNENSGEVYQEHYRYFYDRLKERYPQITYIANCDIPGAPIDTIDEHYYNNPGFFAANATKYDSYDRSGPDIYVGEYACNSEEAGRGNLVAAISEAAFIVGMERNADIVKMTSYAPLFCNVNDRRWPVNLICFDGAESYGIPSYHVQKAFAENQGDVVVNAEIEACDRAYAGNQLFVTAAVDKRAGEVIVKVVNFTGRTVVTGLQVDGTAVVDTGLATVVTSWDAKDENSLSDPRKIEALPVSVADPSGFRFRPWSLTILRVKLVR